MRRSRRGSILVLSLLVVTIGLLVGTSVIYYAGADRRAAQAGLRRVQARSMAWSGVQAVLAELSEQRDGLIGGEAPSLTEVWVAPVPTQGAGASSSEPRWGYRVLPVRGKPLTSEMGKLDVNSVPASILAKLPGLTETLAAAIVSAREKHRFTSVAELLGVPGMTYEMLYGQGTPTSTAAGGEAVPLARLVTAYSFDPEVQVGVGAKASESAGKQRININAPWSEELGEAIEDRFDKGVADGVKALMERGEKFEKPSSIVKKLREMKVEPKDWVEVLDAFTTNPDLYRLGAVDLLTAPVEVLECIPGISTDAAEEIVARREKLDASRRGTVAWPVLEEIMKPEDFELAVDALTTRSVQWRVIIEGGLFPITADGVSLDPGPDWEQARGAATTPGGTENSTEPLEDRVVLEVVIDVSSRRARVAYLREVTFLPVAASLSGGAKDRELAHEQRANIAQESSSGPGTESLPDALHTELNMPALDLDPSKEEDAGADLASNRLDSKALEMPETEAGGEGNETRGAGEPREDAESTPASSRVPEARDRRLGRWTTGSGGPR